MKNKITLDKLYIFIIILILFIILIIFTLLESKQISEMKKFVAEMELIQEKVNLIRNEYKTWKDYDFNEAGNFNLYLQELGFDNANGSTNIYINEFNNIITELTKNNLDCWDDTDSIISNYCYFNPQSLKSKLGLEDINRYVIINFYTGNIIAKDGIKDKFNKNRLIYRQYDTKIGNKLISTPIDNPEVLPKLEVLENNGLNQKIRICLSDGRNVENVPDILEVYYVDKQSENRNKCSMLNNYIYESSEKSVYFTMEKSGEYSFIVEDTNHIEYPKIDLEINLCNPPILLDDMKGIYWDENGEELEIEKNNDSNWYNYAKDTLKMANAKTSDGNYWVWLPRYIYKEIENSVQIDFVYGNSNNSTKNKDVRDYKMQEAFEENSKLTGLWISKFQVNNENSTKLVIKPGQTLTIANKYIAQQNCLKLLPENIRKYSKLMSDGEKNSVLLYSKAMGVEITNDLIHYSGGSPLENGFVKNGRYSSTGNAYGIYDLITSENQLTIASSNNEAGRYRPVLIIQ